MTATPLHFISSMATRTLLHDLAALYPARHATPVRIEAVAGVEAARRVQAGEAFDAVVLAANVIDKLIAEGHLRAGSKVDLVRSGVVVAVRSGTPLPPIHSEADVRAAVLAAPSLGYSTGPSGVYLMTLFERWGIAEQIKPRIVQAPPGVPVGAFIADGRVALGFQQLSELMNLDGVAVVGALPASIQLMTTFSAGIPVGCTRADALRALLAFMASPAATATKQLNGLEPA